MIKVSKEDKMASSVGHAFAILKGRATGDREDASRYLNEMSPTQLIMRNRSESRIRARIKKRKDLRLGHRPRPRI